MDNKVPAIPVGWSLVGHGAGACLITRPLKRGLPTPAGQWCLFVGPAVVGRSNGGSEGKRGSTCNVAPSRQRQRLSLWLGEDDATLGFGAVRRRLRMVLYVVGRISRDRHQVFG